MLLFCRQQRHFFAISAAGYPPVQGVFPAIRPQYCLDPLFWIFYKIGLIEGKIIWNEKEKTYLLHILAQDPVRFHWCANRQYDTNEARSQTAWGLDATWTDVKSHPASVHVLGHSMILRFAIGNVRGCHFQRLHMTPLNFYTSWPLVLQVFAKNLR